MIDGYKCRDGEVIVVEYDKDDVRSETYRSYQDNIEELLMTLNIEEYLYDYKEKMENLISENENEIINWKKEKDLRVVCILMIHIISLVPALFLKPVLIPLICMFFWFVYKKCLKKCSNLIDECQREIDGAKLTLEGIEEELQKNKVDIRRLINDDKVTKEDISSDYKQLNYLEELKKIKEYLELWYVSGTNKNQFLEYIEDNELEDNIYEDFSEEEIKIIKRILTDRSKKRY